MKGKQMIGGQNSRHESAQGISIDNSANAASQTGQQEELCPLQSKLVFHLHEKTLQRGSACARRRAMGLCAATSTRCTCDKGGLEDTYHDA